MANIIYRTNNPAAPNATVYKEAPLNKREIDGNFKSIADELDTKADGGDNTDITSLQGKPIESLLQKTSDTGSAILPSGTTAQRNSGSVGGHIRFNSELNLYEGRLKNGWDVLQGKPGITGSIGPVGPAGPAGIEGPTGPIGNYLGLQLTGTVVSEDELPITGNENEVYGLVSGDTVTIYIWRDGAWFNAGPISSPDRNISNVVFVSPDGNDTNSGKTLATAVATLEQGLIIAKAKSLINGVNNPVPVAIEVYPGDYRTEGHLDVPDMCCVIGIGTARSNRIIPKVGFEKRNVFRLGSGSYITGFSFEGFQIDDLNNPSEGFAVAFRPSTVDYPTVITRVPYAHNITVYRRQTPELISAPLDRLNGNPLVGNGGGVVLADKAVISGYSIFPNIMTWGATPSSPNGIGYACKNGGLINPVNAIALWGHKQFLCLSGGQMILSGCSTQFGDYSFWSEGHTLSIVPVPVSTEAINALGGGQPVEGAKLLDPSVQTTIIETFIANYPGLNELNSDQLVKTRKDTRLLLMALGYSLSSGQTRAIEEFILGLHDFSGEPYFTTKYNYPDVDCVIESPESNNANLKKIVLTGNYTNNVNIKVGQRIISQHLPIGTTILSLNLDTNNNLVIMTDTSATNKTQVLNCSLTFIEINDDLKTKFITSFNHIESLINSYNPTLAKYNYMTNSSSRDFISACFDSIVSSLNNQTKKKERSLITAINHQWTLPLSGVTRSSVPSRFGGTGVASAIPRSVVQRLGGRVRYSGQDDEGNAVFVGGLRIDSNSGELRGPPFDIAIRKRATKISIARSF